MGMQKQQNRPFFSGGAIASRRPRSGARTRFLPAKAGHHLRRPLDVGVGRGFAGQLGQDAHPLQGGGEGETPEDPHGRLVLLGRRGNGCQGWDGASLGGGTSPGAVKNNHLGSPSHPGPRDLPCPAAVLPRAEVSSQPRPLSQTAGRREAHPPPPPLPPSSPGAETKADAGMAKPCLATPKLHPPPGWFKHPL